MFLAQDHSVAPQLLEKIGLGNSSSASYQDATKAQLSMDDYANPSEQKEDLNEAKDFMAMARDMEDKQQEVKEAEQGLSLSDRLAQDKNAPDVAQKKVLSIFHIPIQTWLIFRPI